MNIKKKCTRSNSDVISSYHGHMVVQWLHECVNSLFGVRSQSENLIVGSASHAPSFIPSHGFLLVGTSKKAQHAEPQMKRDRTIDWCCVRSLSWHSWASNYAHLGADHTRRKPRRDPAEYARTPTPRRRYIKLLQLSREIHRWRWCVWFSRRKAPDWFSIRVVV